jgi:hypothetical protein
MAKTSWLKSKWKPILFCSKQLEYIGYWITQDGIQPAQTKVATIQKISASKIEEGTMPVHRHGKLLSRHVDASI